MSKTVAYICDYKDHLMEENAIIGINPIEDLYDRLMSYPIVKNSAKTDVHACTECYKKAVLIPASHEVDRKRNEKAYAAKVKELSYGFRAQTVHNHRLKNKFKKSGK